MGTTAKPLHQALYSIQKINKKYKAMYLHPSTLSHFLLFFFLSLLFQIINRFQSLQALGTDTRPACSRKRTQHGRVPTVHSANVGPLHPYVCMAISFRWRARDWQMSPPHRSSRPPVVVGQQTNEPMALRVSLACSSSFSLGALLTNGGKYSLYE